MCCCCVSAFAGCPGHAATCLHCIAHISSKIWRSCCSNRLPEAFTCLHTCRQAQMPAQRLMRMTLRRKMKTRTLRLQMHQANRMSRRIGARCGLQHHPRLHGNTGRPQPPSPPSGLRRPAAGARHGRARQRHRHPRRRWWRGDRACAEPPDEQRASLTRVVSAKLLHCF